MSKFTTSSFLLAVLLAACGISGSSGQPSAPTWQRDVRPIVAQKCGDCHTAGGSAPLSFDAPPVAAVAALMAERTAAGVMPPGMAGPAGVAALGAWRALSAGEQATIGAWFAAGAPIGNPADFAARPPGAAPLGPPTVVLPLSRPYVQAPPAPGAQDDNRCFLLPSPDRMTVTGFGFRPGAGRPHHLTVALVDAAGAAAAKALDGKDGRPGWPCDNPFAGLPPVLELGGGGSEPGDVPLPAGVGAVIPPGGAVVLQLHYSLLSQQPDQSGVALWLSSAAPTYPLAVYDLQATAILPCPTGANVPAADPCSLDYAYRHHQLWDYATIKAYNEQVLTSSGQYLSEYLGAQTYQAAPQRYFPVRSVAALRPGASGRIVTLKLHMHPWGRAGRVELLRADGSTQILLDLPRYDWRWHDKVFVVADPPPIKAGDAVRLTCDMDNGTDAQPAAGELPRMRISGPGKTDSMCVAALGVAAGWM